MRPLLAGLLALTLALPSAVGAWPRHYSSGGTSHTYRTSSSSTHRAHASTGSGHVRGTSTSKSYRDPAQKAAFRHNHPCPSTGRTGGACPGYEVDHVRPLACGGADDPGNMQWLTKAQNRAKGSEGCRR